MRDVTPATLSLRTSIRDRRWPCQRALAGGHIGLPVQEVVQGQITGLPVPTDAERVLEGCMQREVEVRAGRSVWRMAGYYASDTRPTRLLKLQAIYHRG